MFRGSRLIEIACSHTEKCAPTPALQATGPEEFLEQVPCLGRQCNHIVLPCWSRCFLANHWFSCRVDWFFLSHGRSPSLSRWEQGLRVTPQDILRRGKTERAIQTQLRSDRRESRPMEALQGQQADMRWRLGRGGGRERRPDARRPRRRCQRFRQTRPAPEPSPQ